jgi:hypothetical protein
VSEFYDWSSNAVCVNSDNKRYWVSYNYEHVKIAKEGCARCPVAIDCFRYSMESEVLAGVVAGSSDLDRLYFKWKKVTDLDGNNWR